jgi:Ca2+-binding EF-hand superfamily protein
MKNVMIIAALGLASPLAFAETEATPSAAEEQTISFEQIDVDKDGMISKQEATSFSSVELIFDDADANQDGALDASEFSQVGSAPSAE